MAEMERKVEQYRLANAESIIRNEARRCGRGACFGGTACCFAASLCRLANAESIIRNEARRWGRGTSCLVCWRASCWLGRVSS